MEAQLTVLAVHQNVDVTDQSRSRIYENVALVLKLRHPQEPFSQGLTAQLVEEKCKALNTPGNMAMAALRSKRDAILQRFEKDLAEISSSA